MNVKMTLKRNSPKILTILAAMGTVSTAFATARATPKALLLIREAESQKGEDLTALEKVKVAAVPYIPAVLLGSATVICTVIMNGLYLKIRIFPKRDHYRIS